MTFRGLHLQLSSGRERMKRILMKVRCVKTEKEAIEFINFMENFRILLLL